MTGRSRPDLIAQVLLATALLQIPTVKPVGVAALIALFAWPWILRSIPVVQRLVYGAILASGVLAAAAGLALRIVSHLRGRPESGLLPYAELISWLAGMVVLVVAVLWAIPKVPVGRALGLLASGWIVTSLITLNDTSNPWKYALAECLTFTALVFAARHRRAIALAVLAISVAVSAVYDSRGPIGFALIVGVLIVLPRSIRATVRDRPVRSVAMAAGVGVALLLALTGAMSMGLLGSEIAQRTNYQNSASVIPIVGARTETGAMRVLALAQPFGYGTGVIVDGQLKDRAITAAGNLGGDTGSTYFYTVVFGERVDLHSVSANLWFHFGLPGLMIALCGGVAMALALFRIVIHEWGGFASPLAYIILTGAWNLAWSPSTDTPLAATGIAVAAFVLISGAPASKVLPARPSIRATSDPHVHVTTKSRRSLAVRVRGRRGLKGTRQDSGEQ